MKASEFTKFEISICSLASTHSVRQSEPQEFERSSTDSMQPAAIQGAAADGLAPELVQGKVH